MHTERHTRTAGHIEHVHATGNGPRRLGERRRTLHLLDVENLLGGWVTSQRVERMWTEYVAAVGVQRGDQVVAGFARRNAEAVAFALPTWLRLVVGTDAIDGADIALTEAVDVRHDATRYGRVAVGSGDGHFATIAARFQDLGTEVVSVLGAAHISTALYLACRRNLTLPSHGAPEPTRVA